MQFAHINIIAKDAAALTRFYKKVLGCESIGETRDIAGEWVDKLTGISHAHIMGEHLRLPGYNGKAPTLEIFGYDGNEQDAIRGINRCGFAHIAFEVEDVKTTLAKVLEAGGGQLGELVSTEYADGRKLTLVYAKDIEGNIIELLNWS